MILGIQEMQFYDVLEDDMHAKVSDWLKCQSYISASGIDREQLWFHRDGTYFNPLWEKRYDRWNSHPFENIIDQEKFIKKFILSFNQNNRKF